MPVKRCSPRRGLLAGLLALVTFVSAAVALTARGPTTGATQPTAAGAIGVGGGDRHGDRREAAFRGRRR
jgi:hypothetical protein